MENYKIVNEILYEFKSKKIILIGCQSKRLIKFLFKYIKTNSGELIVIDPQPKSNIDELINDNNVNFTFYNEDSLKILTDFQEYDAIFIDGNPNWYTTYNELNIIEKNTKEFPLIFVCNSIFPNERRDTYYYFNNIPSDNIIINSKKLTIFQDAHDRSKKIVIQDENYHAVYSNTEKNGVLTAIEDYLLESSLDINKTLIDSKTGIELIYFKDNDTFKNLSESDNTNYFYNLEIRNEYLNSYLLDLTENESDKIDDNEDQLTLKLNRYEEENEDLKKLLESKEELLKNKDDLIKHNNELLKSYDILSISKDDIIHSKEKHDNDETKSSETPKNGKITFQNLLDYDDITISLLKSSNFRIFSIILSYLYIIYKFKFGHNLKLNLKLFKLIKNKNWLNIGFYLENNKDLSESKWFKRLTPEAHYICNGYYENRLPHPHFNSTLTKEEIMKKLMEEHQ